MGASKNKPELLRHFLSIICSRPNISLACKASGLGETTFRTFLKRSRAGDPALMIDFPEGSEPQQFADCLTFARRQSLILFELTIRDHCLNGIARILRNPSSGDIVYEKDPRFIGLSDDDMRLIGEDDPSVEFCRLLRDEKGMPVPVVVYDQAPAHLKIKLLESAVPGFVDRKVVSLDQTVSGSVQVIAAPGQSDADVKKFIAEQNKPKQIEAAVVDEEIVFDDDASLTESAPAEVDIAWPVANAAPTHEQIAANAVKLNETLKPKSPAIKKLKRLAALSPEERRAELASKPSPQNPPRFVSMEEKSEGVGYGLTAEQIKQRGGFKIA